MAESYVDLFDLEASSFLDRLYKLVVVIYDYAIEQVDRVYADEIGKLKQEMGTTSDESLREERHFFASAFERELEDQVRALATIAIAMLATLIDSFL